MHLQAMNDPLLKTKDVARFLGMSPRQVRNLVDAGKLGAVRLDNHLRFSKADVARLIAASTTASSFDGVGSRSESPTVRSRRASTDVDALAPIPF